MGKLNSHEDFKFKLKEPLDLVSGVSNTLLFIPANEV